MVSELRFRYYPLLLNYAAFVNVPVVLARCQIILHALVDLSTNVHRSQFFGEKIIPIQKGTRSMSVFIIFAKGTPNLRLLYVASLRNWRRWPGCGSVVDAVGLAAVLWLPRLLMFFYSQFSCRCGYSQLFALCAQKRENMERWR